METAAIDNLECGTVKIVVGNDASCWSRVINGRDCGRTCRDRSDGLRLIDKVVDHPGLAATVHATNARHIDILSIRCEIEGCCEVLGDVEVEVRTEAETVHVTLRIVAEIVRVLSVEVTTLMDVTDVEEVVDIVSTTGQIGIHTGLRSVLLEIHAVEVIVAVGVLPHGCLCLIVRICRIETEERVLVFVNDFL